MSTANTSSTRGHGHDRSAAFCLSGFPRSLVFSTVALSLRRNLIDAFGADVSDVFLRLKVGYENAGAWTNALDKKVHGVSPGIDELIRREERRLDVARKLLRPVTVRWVQASSSDACGNQWWGVSKCFGLVLEREANTSKQYDYFFRVRPDLLWIRRFPHYSIYEAAEGANWVVLIRDYVVLSRRTMAEKLWRRPFYSCRDGAGLPGRRSRETMLAGHLKRTGADTRYMCMTMTVKHREERADGSWWQCSYPGRWVEASRHERRDPGKWLCLTPIELVRTMHNRSSDSVSLSDQLVEDLHLMSNNVSNQIIQKVEEWHRLPSCSGHCWASALHNLEHTTMNAMELDTSLAQCEAKLSDQAWASPKEDETLPDPRKAKLAISPGSAVLGHTRTCGPSLDWSHVVCDQAANHNHDSSINALTHLPYPTLPAYREYKPYEGRLRISEGLLVDFMGFTIPEHLYCNEAYVHQTEAHALRVRQCRIYKYLSSSLFGKPSQIVFKTEWPVISEEYFEYADVLASVSEFAAELASLDTQHMPRPFAFVELGAGYGHWTFTAHKALMQRVPAATYKYVMVDIVKSLQPEIVKLAALNGVNVTETAEGPLQFHHGYVGGDKYVNELAVDFKTLWGLDTSKESSDPGPSISIATLFQMYKVPCVVDMIDVDIQDAEFQLFDDPTMHLLTERVRRVHIGIHRISDDLVKVFVEKYSWQLSWNFPLSAPWNFDTPMGPVRFGDGVNGFKNPHQLTCASEGSR